MKKDIINRKEVNKADRELQKRHPRNPYAKAFYDFCLANPELRFWQAVYNFTGVKNIFISNKTKEETTMITVADPFHWEGLDK